MTTDEGAKDRLDDLFERISRLADSELMVLRSAWEEADAQPRQQAWQSVKQLVETHGRAGLLDEARGRLSAWVNNYLTATAVEYGNFLISAGSGMDAATVRRQALPPLLDAVAATVVSDRLPPQERLTLLEPLASVERG